jgi:hypothetical protein
MIVLHSSMPVEETTTNGKCQVLHFDMQEENMIEHTHAKCYLCTLLVKL